MMPDDKTVNQRYMPTLGNGHLATTVFGDGIYMNGFYSGVGSEYVVYASLSYVVHTNDL